MDQDDKGICICTRSREIVKCVSCGYETYGRVYKECLMHPKRRYLNDILECPRCSATDLKAIKATTI